MWQLQASKRGFRTSYKPIKNTKIHALFFPYHKAISLLSGLLAKAPPEANHYHEWPKRRSWRKDTSFSVVHFSKRYKYITLCLILPCSRPTLKPKARTHAAVSSLLRIRRSCFSNLIKTVIAVFHDIKSLGMPNH